MNARKRGQKKPNKNLAYIRYYAHRHKPSFIVVIQIVDAIAIIPKTIRTRAESTRSRILFTHLERKRVTSISNKRRMEKCTPE